ncbi:MAG: nucleotidyltransferase family protein [Fimbriimonadaceae bacterium]|nr:nucleotidyltransferase family protein [Chitinophagales bacterium]
MILTQEDIKSKLREIKPYLSDKYFVNKIGYFGSYSRNEFNEDSDIDILVEFVKPIGWDYFLLEEYLEKIFEKKIDLVTPNALKPQLKKYILNEVIYI